MSSESNEGGVIPPRLWPVAQLLAQGLGHAIGLWDALSTTSCWTESSTVYPLMKNSNTNCGSFGSNITATYNEALYAVIRSGWS